MATPRFHPLARLILCALGVFIAVQSIHGVMAAVTYFSATLSDRTPQQQIIDFFEQYVLLVLVLPYPSVLLWIIFCRSTLDRRSLASLGLHRHRSAGDVIRGLAGGALAVSLLFGVLWLTGHAAFTGWSPEAFDASPWRTLGWLMVWAAAFLLVGFMEELLFRGYALHNLHAWLGLRAAIGTQAVVFAVIHLGNVFATDAFFQGATTAWADAWRAMPNITLVGVFFALCYLKTGSLWFPIGFHAAWNFFLGCIYSLPVSGLNIFRLLDIEISSDSWITGGVFGPEGSLLLTPILLLLSYVTAKLPDHPQAEADLNSLNRQSTPAQSTLPVTESEDEGSYLSGVRLPTRACESFDPEVLASVQTVAATPQSVTEAEKPRVLLMDDPEEEKPIEADESETRADETPVPAPQPPAKPRPRW